MGAILPFVGYVSKSMLGLPRARAQEESEAAETISRFVRIVSSSECRDAVLSKTGCLYNPDEIPPDAWLREIVTETDFDARPELERLLNQVDTSFTLVVAGMDNHILRGNLHSIRSLDLLFEGRIPVIDAGEALTVHGNRLSNRPKIDAAKWIKLIKSRFMYDHTRLNRSLLRRRLVPA